METTVKGSEKEVIIGGDRPTVLIGERINPSGKKKLAEALKSGDLDTVKAEATSQIDAGADVLDVNVVTPGVDEKVLLPKAVEAVMETVDAPICIDINDPEALKEALKICPGKPIINSVSGEEKSLNEILPLVKEYGTAVIGLTLDDNGIPKEAGKRIEIAHKIVERAEAMGIPKSDVIIDCLALSLGSDTNAGKVTLEAIQGVKEQLELNQTLGASNISFGLPNRFVVNTAFLSVAITAGLTCPTVDAARVRSTVLATDLILGRDAFAQRFIQDFRKNQ